MNSITLVAAPSELNSPFFLKNKHVCEVWEGFIKKHEGTIKGKCSVWALIVEGKIKKNTIWTFKIKKSTSSTSNIFISSKKAIIEFSTIQASDINLKCTSFRIRKYKWLDFIRLKLSSNHMRVNKELVLIAKNINRVEENRLVELIKKLPITIKADIVQYNDEKKTLMLRFQSILDDLEFVERIMQL